MERNAYYQSDSTMILYRTIFYMTIAVLVYVFLFNECSTGALINFCSRYTCVLTNQ